METYLNSFEYEYKTNLSNPVRVDEINILISEMAMKKLNYFHGKEN